MLPTWEQCLVHHETGTDLHSSPMLMVFVDRGRFSRTIRLYQMTLSSAACYGTRCHQSSSIASCHTKKPMLFVRDDHHCISAKRTNFPSDQHQPSRPFSSAAGIAAPEVDKNSSLCGPIHQWNHLQHDTLHWLELFFQSCGPRALQILCPEGWGCAKNKNRIFDFT